MAATHFNLNHTQQHKEWLSKGQHQENGHGNYSQESLAHVLKHDHIYPDHWLLTQKQNEVDPTEEYAQGTELPLPARQAVKLEVAHKDDGGHVQYALHVVDEVEEVVSDVTNDLVEFHRNPDNAGEDDKHRAHYQTVSVTFQLLRNSY